MLVDATVRFESGEAPTAEAVTMWRRQERARAIAAETAAAAGQVRVLWRRQCSTFPPPPPSGTCPGLPFPLALLWPPLPHRPIPIVPYLLPRLTCVSACVHVRLCAARS